MKNTGCLICGSDLQYLNQSLIMECEVCHKEISSNAQCVKNHFICDNCHELQGFDYINQYCLQSKSTNPVEMANVIMNNPVINMHGPEHHFLVPAVLITAYYNKIGKSSLIPEKLKIARDRSKNILGGFCGFYGTCGAGIGSGIYMSIILNSNPLKNDEWKKSNMLSAQCLFRIAEHGGPRCCKRDTYLSLETSINFTKKQLKVQLNSSEIKCNFSNRNKECKLQECNYYQD